MFGTSDPFSPWAELSAAPWASAQRTIDIIPHAGHYPWIDDPAFIDRPRAFILAER